MVGVRGCLARHSSGFYRSGPSDRGVGCRRAKSPRGSGSPAPLQAQDGPPCEITYGQARRARRRRVTRVINMTVEGRLTCGDMLGPGDCPAHGAPVGGGGL